MDDEDLATMAALERYRELGSDLSRLMEIDFFVAVTNRAAAEAVAARVQSLGFSPSVEQAADTGDWTCYCRKTLIPSFDAVRAIERQLDAIARTYGGRADGFGSFGNRTPSS